MEHADPTSAQSIKNGAYVIDHVVPLKRSGADATSNMQWQTVEDAKAKERVE